MADLPDAKKNIQLEETQFRAAVSESTLQKMGSAMNFINNRQHSEKQWFINGSYNLAPMPQTAVDGLVFFQYDAEIIDVWMFIEFAGSSGVTEIDIKRATTSGGAFTSIFTTTPKIDALAGNYYWIHVGSTGLSGSSTAPVLALTNVNAGDALRMDIIQSQVGAAVNGSGILLHYRPR